MPKVRSPRELQLVQQRARREVIEPRMDENLHPRVFAVPRDARRVRPSSFPPSDLWGVELIQRAPHEHQGRSQSFQTLRHVFRDTERRGVSDERDVTQRRRRRRESSNEPSTDRPAGPDGAAIGGGGDREQGETNGTGDVRGHPPPLGEAGRGDEDDPTDVARVRIRVQTRHHAAEREAAEHERDARGGVRIRVVGVESVRVIVDAVVGPSDAQEDAAELRRARFGGMSAVVRQARGLAVAVEVQQQHVVSVSIAELRGGVKPTGVVHQPTVEEHHARALAVRGGMRRARHLTTGEEHPETEVVVAIAAAGGGRRRRARRRRVSFLQAHPHAPRDRQKIQGARPETVVERPVDRSSARSPVAHIAEIFDWRE